MDKYKAGEGKGEETDVKTDEKIRKLKRDCDKALEILSKHLSSSLYEEIQDLIFNYIYEYARFFREIEKGE